MLDTPRGLIGVVHLAPLPGDPKAGPKSTYRSVECAALEDARALKEGGADAIIIENFGSAPFAKGVAGSRAPSHQVAALAVVAAGCRDLGLPFGINCLRNDAMASLGVAAATGASFVRVNIHIGTYVTDQGIIEGEADQSVRYRSSLGSPIAILADILVKHASPLAPVNAENATRDTVSRGLADGVIVTGPATRVPLDLEELVTVRRAAADRPVYIGSGMRPDNVADLAPLASGAIVGTWIKKDGELANPVDPARVETLAKKLREVWG